MNNYCGFIAIVGRPNVGKSTLMNHLIGQKVSITSRKPQTTQHKINGITTKDNYQYIFVDTPGFQTIYTNKLNTLLNKSVITSLSRIDVILFVVEAGIFNDGDATVMSILPPQSNVILIVNKKENLKNKSDLKNFITTVQPRYPFKTTITVSAKNHIGINEIINSINPYMPTGEFLYPTDQLTDKNMKFLTSEIIREKLFRYLGEELPYNTAVEINNFKEEQNLYKISATIIVSKENQKGIVIGKNGDKLKKISTEARIDMESLCNKKIFLQLWVKVTSGFVNDPKFLAQFDNI